MPGIFSFYDLTVESDIQLPCPEGENVSPNVTVRSSEKPHLPETPGDGVYSFLVSPTEASFIYSEVAFYSIIDGTSIYMEMQRGVDQRIAVNTLLGTPFGILLLQRGHAVFHGSSVTIDNKSVCFMGESGAGKSTTAALMMARGHRLVTDDVVALQTDGESMPGLLPGYPWMKVGREAVDVLGISSDVISDLQSGSKKLRMHTAAGGFCENPPAVAAIYFPVWSDRVEIEKLQANTAMLYLVANGYGFVPRTEFPLEEKERFRRYAELAARVPCFLLKRPRDMRELSTLARMLEDHILTDHVAK